MLGPVLETIAAGLAEVGMSVVPSEITHKTRCQQLAKFGFDMRCVFRRQGHIGRAGSKFIQTESIKIQNRYK
jgi:hypothetical protein